MSQGQVYVREKVRGATEIASTGKSAATNLIGCADTNGTTDVFARRLASWEVRPGAPGLTNLR